MLKKFVIPFFVILFITSVAKNIAFLFENNTLRSQIMLWQANEAIKKYAEYWLAKVSYPQNASVKSETPIHVMVKPVNTDPSRSCTKDFYLVDIDGNIISQLSLNDDGKGNDATAGDNIYSGLYTFDLEGYYWVKTLFKENEKEKFAVNASEFIRVLPFEVIASNNISLGGPPEYDTATFNIQNNSDKAIQLQTELGSTPTEWTQQYRSEIFTLVAGAQKKVTVTVFSRYDWCDLLGNVYLDTTLIEGYQPSFYNYRQGTIKSDVNVFIAPFCDNPPKMSPQ